MNKSRPTLNENQPQVEQEMLWAGMSKVKRRNIHRIVLELLLPYSAQAFDARKNPTN
jgi:hypothetical protein